MTGALAPGVAPLALVQIPKTLLIRARRWPPCGWVRRAPRRGLVGVRRLRDALRRITGHGVRMPAPGPPTAARLIVLPPIASNGCALFSLVGRLGGVPLLAVQAVAGRACPPGGLGAQPPAGERPAGRGRAAWGLDFFPPGEAERGTG